MTVRSPAVAGSFYPADPRVLTAQIDGMLRDAKPSGHPPPKALIAPHAGTVYSGPIAASAYVEVQPIAERIERVVLLGPSHRVYLEGLALPTVARFATPLGVIPIDEPLAERVAQLEGVTRDDAPHAREHSLEIHLPFLQRVLPRFTLLPLVVGRARPEVVAAVLEEVWGGPETLIVISTDLSHFHDYDTARETDRRTSELIEALDYGGLNGERACGAYPVSGLLALAARRGLSVRCVDRRNSGDTAGTPDRVVGYGSYVVH